MSAVKLQKTLYLQQGERNCRLMAARNILLSLIAAVLQISCGVKNFVPEDGDLMFCIAGTSEMSGAISSATAREDSLSFDHVAIFSRMDGKPTVIEASAKKGAVVRTALEEFLSGQAAVGGKPGVVVMRINGSFDSAAAVRRAESMLGLPYDWAYLPSNGRLYCSELVYESYLDSLGRHIFPAKPMNFRSPDGTLPQFWQELFSRLGTPVPEGLPGTSPNDLSKEDCLIEVFRYF